VGLNFASALRSFLRQDPDVIMVGEIRDLETAEIAIKAAQTGHLVLSTLHTNSAAETITRLLNMGVPAFNVATSVSLIIAQRLGRRLCKECKTPADDIPREVLLKEGFTEEMLATATIMKAVGCDACKDGYKGRIGIYEVVRITPEIADLIMSEGNSLQISRQARELGFADLRTSALRKCAAGLVSLEEVNRVTID
jgi:type IV pilus assembly protein PilB